MKIDLNEIPLIDNHCHPFPASRNPSYFERLVTLSLLPQKTESVRSTIVFQMFCNALRGYFGLDMNTTTEELIAYREKRVAEDRIQYFKDMFTDANLIGFLVDFGFPVNHANALRPEEIAASKEDMKDYIVKSLDRIEWVANDILEQKELLDFDEFARRYEANVRTMIKEKDLIALKSIIAYTTGLEVKVLPEKEVREGYYRYLCDRTSRADEKIIRDYCFCKACEICQELDIPMQVHTAFGDSPLCDLGKCNPLNMYEVINAYKETKLILIHAGYPFCEELGFLMNHYENVYGDVSSMVPYAGYAGETKIKELLELAPTTKLMYGTDGGLVPDGIWWGAKMFRSYFSNILQELMDKNYISATFAREMAENIMYKNVRRIYKF